MNQTSQLILACLLIALATFLAGVFTLKFENRWFTNLKVLLGLGCGILLALLCIEFLPHSFHHDSHHAGAFVLVGMLTYFIVDRFLIPRLEFLDGLLKRPSHGQNSPKPPLIGSHTACSVVGCLTVCSFFDGVQLQSAYSIGEETGIAMSLGLLFHMLPNGALAATVTSAGGMQKRASSISSLLVGGFLLFGALSAAALRRFEFLGNHAISMASGVLIYIIFSHLIPAMGQSRKAQLTLLLSAGVFSTLLLQLDH